MPHHGKVWRAGMDNKYTALASLSAVGLAFLAGRALEVHCLYIDKVALFAAQSVVFLLEGQFKRKDRSRLTTVILNL